MSRVGWLDCASGASGDMLLGALVGAGVPLAALRHAVDELRLGITLDSAPIERGGLAAVAVRVYPPPDPQPRRTLRDIRAIVTDDRASRVFERIAAAEGAVHGIAAEQVHFHEVGALDALADVVGVCAGFAHLGLAALHASPVALGGGSVASAHGVLPVPAPAVLELLRGIPSYGGPVDVELCTPTGAALLAEWVTGWGPMPPLAPHAVGIGAGARELPGRANVLRLVVGEAAGAVLVEANVDDLDPRLWPGVLDALLVAGADDAWLTAITMKKGRPAHTLSVLARPAVLDAVRDVVFAETSTIGLREIAVGKHALARDTVTVEVDGAPVRVKVSRRHGVVVNASAEYADVLAAATALGRPTKTVLAAANAAAHAAISTSRVR